MTSRSALCALVCLAAACSREPRDVSIVVYAAYGSERAVHVHGRALESEDRTEARASDTRARNLRRTLDDFESDEVPGLALSVRAGARSALVTTDEEGFFRITLDTAGEPPFSLDPPPGVVVEAVPGRLDLRVRPWSGQVTMLPEASLVVVSDIDDTIVESGVTDKTTLAGRTLFRNPHQLEPVPGVAELYRRLDVPVFYLSGSPVNLHERIRTFLRIHDFPDGPMLLKDFGTGEADPLFDQQEYKLERLRGLAADLPAARFVLFGDSGEQDALVYGRFRSEFPERVVAVFIRRVGPDAEPSVPDGVLLTSEAAEAAQVLEELLGSR